MSEETELHALVTLESQFIEGCCHGSEKLIPKNAAEKEIRLQQIRERFNRRFARIANLYRDKLIELYGEEKGKQVRYAEAFEVCEYGRQPSAEELRQLFPVLPKKD